jgi:hypothetical protein
MDTCHIKKLASRRNLGHLSPRKYLKPNWSQRLQTHSSQGKDISLDSRNGHIQPLEHHKNITIFNVLFDF